MPTLTRVIASDPDPFCRQLAIHAAATLRSPASLPALLQLSESDSEEECRWALIWVFKEYAAPECEPYLRRIFENDSNSSGDRVVAAWGLAKRGDTVAHQFLEHVLEDPEVRTPSFDNSIRAAQALCDLHRWPFEGRVGSVAATRAQLAAQRANESPF